MKIGLYFGSFNPIHIGHMAIANYFVEYTDIRQVWFVISPHNPFKRKITLLNDQDRYNILLKATQGDDRFRVSDIELKMPGPSYTIDTLTSVKRQYPNDEFVLLMGSDGLPTFDKWKNYHLIIENYKRYIYPRTGYEKIDINLHENIMVVDAPLIQISSSFIRDALKNNKDIRHFLPYGIYQYIRKMKFYS